MRGITKQAPPANVSPPGQQARTLTQAAIDFTNGLGMMSYLGIIDGIPTYEYESLKQLRLTHVVNKAAYGLIKVKRFA